MIFTIHENWEEAFGTFRNWYRVCDHFDLINGYPFKSENFNVDGIGKPLVRIRDILSDSLPTFFDGDDGNDIVIKDGDIVIGMDGDFNSITWAKGEALLNQRVCALRAKEHAGVDPRILSYQLPISLKIINDLTPWSTVKHLSSLDVLSLRFPKFDLAAQRQIADFLDRETARIDLLIEKKQRLVALLGEKLEDDILRAVTLGIDPDAELVPEDELEWTSHRPRHWNVCRLKHFFRENTQYSIDGQETLFSLRMKEGLVPHNDVSDKEIPPSDLINYKKVFPDQIVMNRMRAAIGLFGLADSAGIVSPDYSIFDVHPNAHAAYFLRLFKTEPMMVAFRLLSKGLGTGHSGFMRLNADNFGRIRVAVPEYEEQRLISAFVEERIGQISHLQTTNDQSIDRLKEYRSALITAAVAGQIDVTAHTRAGTTDRQFDRLQLETCA